MRAEAADSKIIVVNHALFFSDLALRAYDPNGGIIPDYDNVVFDEAHHLEDIVSKCFGIEMDSNRIHWLLERIRKTVIKRIQFNSQYGFPTSIAAGTPPALNPQESP